MEEGIRSTCKPRWGMMTFAFLNDGFKPTLWHTLYQVVGPIGGKYDGIYTEGAPKSLKQAKEWDKIYEQRRLEREEIEDANS